MRVDGSLNMFTIVLPFSVGTFLIATLVDLLETPSAVSRMVMMSVVGILRDVNKMLMVERHALFTSEGCRASTLARLHVQNLNRRRAVHLFEEQDARSRRGKTGRFCPRSRRE